jgi:hypothetical protein
MNTFRPLTVVILLAFALGMNACSSARSKLDFSLTNITGAPLKHVYLSPSASNGWEEDLLAGTDLKSGSTLNVSFNLNETATMWDLRIEGAGGGYAEWKNLKLGDISEIKVRLQSSPRPTVIAEVE